MSSKDTESRKFGMHPDLIYSVIKNQSGSQSKAFLESIMNAIDAGSSKVTIDVDEKQFSISDDGRGFESKQTIIDFFETFGTPHKEGDATYGRYRMGRGQLMSFATNVWHTGAFKMVVDIKNRGLDYDLIEDQKNLKAGCHITGEWYTKMLPSELDGMARDLKEMSAFAQIPVIFNGKQINTSPKDFKWDFETDEAYFKFSEVGGLKLYNLGVLVTNYPNFKFGLGGIVVSKKQLKVNFARNDILINECEEWKKISKCIKAKVDEMLGVKAQRKTKITEDERVSMVRRGVAGDYSDMSTFIRESKIVTNIKGDHVTIEKLFYSDSVVPITFTEQGSLVGDQLHKKGLAYVLTTNNLERFDVQSPEEFFDAIIQICKHTKKSWDVDYAKKLKSRYKEFSQVKGAISDEHKIIEKKDLPLRKRLAVSALEYMVGEVARLFLPSINREVSQRRLRIGVSETALGWTDGSSYIAINLKLIDAILKDGFRGMVHAAEVIAHEYCHDNNSSDSHAHDLEFYESFHNVVTYYPEKDSGYTHYCYLSIGYIAERAMAEMASAFRKAEQRVPGSTSAHLDHSAKIDTAPKAIEIMTDNPVELPSSDVVVETSESTIEKSDGNASGNGPVNKVKASNKPKIKPATGFSSFTALQTDLFGSPA